MTTGRTKLRPKPDHAGVGLNYGWATDAATIIQNWQCTMCNRQIGYSWSGMFSTTWQPVQNESCSFFFHIRTVLTRNAFPRKLRITVLQKKYAVKTSIFVSHVWSFSTVIPHCQGFYFRFPLSGQRQLLVNKTEPKPWQMPEVQICASQPVIDTH